MVRSELVTRLAAQNPHLYGKDCEPIVRTILDRITEALAPATGLRSEASGPSRAKIFGRGRAAIRGLAKPSPSPRMRLGKPENLSNREAGQERGRKQQALRAEERARDLALVIAVVRAEGAVSLRQIAAALNSRGIPAARGGVWPASQARRVLVQG